jgi:hypothetical protein
MTANAKTDVPNQLKAAVEEVAIVLGAVLLEVDEAAAAKIATGKIAKSR